MDFAIIFSALLPLVFLAEIILYCVGWTVVEFLQENHDSPLMDLAVGNVLGFFVAILGYLIYTVG